MDIRIEVKVWALYVMMRYSSWENKPFFWKKIMIKNLKLYYTSKKREAILHFRKHLMPWHVHE